MRVITLIYIYIYIYMYIQRPSLSRRANCYSVSEIAVGGGVGSKCTEVVVGGGGGVKLLVNLFWVAG